MTSRKLRKPIVVLIPRELLEGWNVIVDKVHSRSANDDNGIKKKPRVFLTSVTHTHGVSIGFAFT